MNRSTFKQLTAGALMLSAAALSLPAVSHQVDPSCDTAGGSHATGRMPMMGGMGGGGPMGMMGDMMGSGPMGMMGDMMGSPMGMMGDMMGSPMGMMGHMMGGPMGMMGDMMGSPMGMMGHMMGGGHHMGMMRKYDRLGLNDEQKQQMSDIQHRLHKKHWELMGPMIDLHADLQKAYAGDRPDPAAVGGVYGKIFDLKRQMIEARLEAKNSMRDVLTEEQREQMKKMQHERRRMMQQGQGGMMQGQGGMMQGQGGMMQGQGGMMQGQGGMMQQDQGGQAN